MWRTRYASLVITVHATLMQINASSRANQCNIKCRFQKLLCPLVRGMSFSLNLLTFSQTYLIVRKRVRTVFPPFSQFQRFQSSRFTLTPPASPSQGRIRPQEAGGKGG